MKRIVWFHRARSILWAAVGIASFPLGWANSVVLVWIASVYANVASDWGASEAANDENILDRIQALEKRNEERHAALIDAIDRLTRALANHDPG